MTVKELSQINGFKPVCTPYTAAAHTRCVEAIQTFPVIDVNKSLLREDGTLIYVDGLAEALEACYENESILSETKFFNKIIER